MQSTNFSYLMEKCMSTRFIGDPATDSRLINSLLSRLLSMWWLLRCCV